MAIYGHVLLVIVTDVIEGLVRRGERNNERQCCQNMDVWSALVFSRFWSFALCWAHGVITDLQKHYAGMRLWS